MEQSLNESSFLSENISSMNILELINKIINNKINCKHVSSKFVYSYICDKKITLMIILIMHIKILTNLILF